MSREPLTHKRSYTNAAVDVKPHLKLLRMEQVSWVSNTVEENLVLHKTPTRLWRLPG